MRIKTLIKNAAASNFLLDKVESIKQDANGRWTVHVKQWKVGNGDRATGHEQVITIFDAKVNGTSVTFQKRTPIE